MCGHTLLINIFFYHVHLLLWLWPCFSPASADPISCATTHVPTATLTNFPAVAAFKKNFAKLKCAINPDDIVAELYSANLISIGDKNSICNQHNSTDQRMMILLNAVEKAITMNHTTFETFLKILSSIDKYQHLVKEIKS